ncbi:MAG: cobalt-precorrin-6A reductase [Cyanobacteria bacterium J06649_5]
MIKPQVWLIGGTSESRELAQTLSARKIPYIVTVTTPEAQALYLEAHRVRVGAMTPAAMSDFALSHNVRCILDASHPFASTVSQQAIALSTAADLGHPISYMRYERSAHHSIEQDGVDQDRTHSQLSEQMNVTVVENLKTLIESDLLRHQRVLFTLGYRSLPQVARLHETSTLFARVLPSEKAIAGAIAAGFSPANIIALRPPVALALEKALWQQWDISYVVAKAAGSASGETVKRQAATALGIHLVLLKRPTLLYPKQTNCVLEAINWCAESLSLY